MLSYFASRFYLKNINFFVDKSGKKKGEKKGSNNDSNINVCEDCDKNKKTSGNIAKKDSDSEGKLVPPVWLYMYHYNTSRILCVCQ